MSLNVDKNTQSVRQDLPPLFSGPLQLPPSLPSSLTSFTTPFTSPQPLSSKRVEEVSISSKPWYEQAERLIRECRSTCSPYQLNLFEELIKANKGEINKPLETEGTIFHLLAKVGAPLAFVDILTRYGADFGAQDSYRNTPLMWAIANANNSMAREILRQMPSSQTDSLNKQSFVYQNNTALHLIIAKGYQTLSSQKKPLGCSNLELMQRVVAAGADVNLPDKNGNTPLHLAYLRRDPEMIKHLIAYGANKAYSNHQNLFPKHMAEMGYDKARTIMQESAGGRFFLLSEEAFKNASNVKALTQV